MGSPAGSPAGSSAGGLPLGLIRHAPLFACFLLELCVARLNPILLVGVYRAVRFEVRGVLFLGALLATGRFVFIPFFRDQEVKHVARDYLAAAQWNKGGRKLLIQWNKGGPRPFIRSRGESDLATSSPCTTRTARKIAIGGRRLRRGCGRAFGRLPFGLLSVLRAVG